MIFYCTKIVNQAKSKIKPCHQGQSSTSDQSKIRQDKQKSFHSQKSSLKLQAVPNHEYNLANHSVSRSHHRFWLQIRILLISLPVRSLTSQIQPQKNQRYLMSFRSFFLFFHLLFYLLTKAWNWLIIFFKTWKWYHLLTKKKFSTNITNIILYQQFLSNKVGNLYINRDIAIELRKNKFFQLFY